MAEIEPFSIHQPHANLYRFLFRVPDDLRNLAQPEEIEAGRSWIKLWLEKHGRVVKKEIQRDIPQQSWFEFKIWLQKA